VEEVKAAMLEVDDLIIAQVFVMDLCVYEGAQQVAH